MVGVSGEIFSGGGMVGNRNILMGAALSPLLPCLKKIINGFVQNKIEHGSKGNSI